MSPSELRLLSGSQNMPIITVIIHYKMISQELSDRVNVLDIPFNLITKVLLGEKS